VNDHSFAALADPDAWAPLAAALLADLGFTLIQSDEPWEPGGSNLLVALRPTPTLRHFDPEIISFWIGREGRGRVSQLDRRTPVPLERRVEWGHVHVIDRLRIENRFLTFGGVLRTRAVRPDLTVVQLSSPGPIVRWGGHSQPNDPLASEIGAFFARLMVPVDFQPGAEAKLVDVPESVLYAMFLEDCRVHIPRSELDLGDPVARWIAREARRVAAGAPADVAAARTLRAELGLVPAHA
jgi:hypothetical protein